MKISKVLQIELILLILVLSVTLIYGSGVFEIRLVSFYNPRNKTRNGVCCGQVNRMRYSPCSIPCNTYFRLCLGHYQNTKSVSPSCTFGTVITKVFEGNRMTFEQDSGSGPPVFRVPFAFSWPGYFTLIVEAWNDANGNRSLTDPKNLILSTIVSDSVMPTSIWQNYSQVSRNTEISFGFRIMCSQHYYGNGCDVSCRSRDDQFGHYTCGKDGKKICKEGWESEFCDKAKCPVNCNTSRGSCDTPSVCRCYMGWHGENCNQCKTHPYCLHGYCQQPWQCICDEGWTGNFCDVDKNYCSKQQPCQNGGVCVPDSLGNYTCLCRTGYRGAKCEHLQCHKAHCFNKGVCQDNAGVGLKCKCKQGFHGNRCELKVKYCSEIKCLNGAHCDNHATGGRCICESGYTGRRCETKIDYCDLKPCRNGGTCLDGVNDYFCKCTNEFFGKNCTLVLDPCSGIRCFNGGTCKTFGKRLMGTCVCSAGFTGIRCESSLSDPCYNVTCFNNGKCSQMTDSTYKCACTSGYSGRLCETPDDTCRSSPCKNGGTCEQTGNTVVCSCKAGFSGATCTKELTLFDEPSNITASKLNIATEFKIILSNSPDKIAGNSATKKSFHQIVIFSVLLAVLKLHI